MQTLAHYSEEALAFVTMLHAVDGLLKYVALAATGSLEAADGVGTKAEMEAILKTLIQVGDLT
jgi:hypothetical protein